MAYQGWFDLELEFMFLIVCRCFVVIQTWSVRGKKYEIAFPINKMCVFPARKPREKAKGFTVWGQIAGRKANPRMCRRSLLFPAGGAVFWVWSLALAHQPQCSGSSTVEYNLLLLGNKFAFLKLYEHNVDTLSRYGLKKYLLNLPGGLKLSILHLI